MTSRRLLGLVIALGALGPPLEAQRRFPGTSHHFEAPKGRLSVHWAPSDERTAHRLILRRAYPEEERTLLRFERSATVYWRADGKALAVTGDDLKGQAATWVFRLGDAPDSTRLDLASTPDSIRRPCIPRSGIRIEMIGWLDDRSLRLRLRSRDPAGRACPDRVWTHTLPAPPSAAGDSTAHPLVRFVRANPGKAALLAYVLLRTITALILIFLASRRGVPGSQLLLQTLSDICLALGCLAYQYPTIVYHLGLTLTFTGLYAMGWEIYATIADFVDEGADRPAEIASVSAEGLGSGFMLPWRLLGGVPAWYMSLEAADGAAGGDVLGALVLLVGGGGFAYWQHRRAGTGGSINWDMVVIGIALALLGLVSLLMP